MLFDGGHDKEWKLEKHHTAKLKYPDGCYIARHPSNDEINAHWEFWMGALAREQVEVLDAMRDMQIVEQYMDGLKQLTPEQAIDRALKFWAYYYPQECRDFLLYTKYQRETLAKASGINKTMHYVGAIPPQIMHFAKLYNREMCLTLPGERFSQLHQIFYKLCPKAKIGGG